MSGLLEKYGDKVMAHLEKSGKYEPWREAYSFVSSVPLGEEHIVPFVDYDEPGTQLRASFKRIHLIRRPERSAKNVYTLVAVDAHTFAASDSIKEG